MITRTPLRCMLLAGLLAALAGPASAQARPIDLHAVMVRKLDGACRVDSERLARFEPRMVVVHALVDQTSLPTGWARAKVLRPLLGGIRKGAVLGMAHPRMGIGGGHGGHFVVGKEYLISMYRINNVYVVDRALECQA